MKATTTHTILSVTGAVLIGAAGAYMLWLRHKLMTIASLALPSVGFGEHELDDLVRGLAAATVVAGIGTLLGLTGSVLALCLARRTQASKRSEELNP